MKGAAGARVARAELEIEIAATPARVWRAIVEDTRLWWREDFYVGAPGSMRFEPRLGGRLFEDWGDGAGVVWYTVIALDPGRSIDLSGHLTAAFGGPATSLLRIEVVERGRASLLRISDSVHGRIDDDKAAGLEQGWRLLFAEGLKPFVER